MILTKQFAPVWVVLISMLTFLTLRYFDPVNLNDYRGQMGGVPPVACCVCVILPVIVVCVYDRGLRLGPQASKTAIKL